MLAFQQFVQAHSTCLIWAAAAICSIVAALLVMLYLANRKEAEKGTFAPDAVHAFGLVVAAIGESIEAFLHF